MRRTWRWGLFCGVGLAACLSVSPIRAQNARSNRASRPSGGIKAETDTNVRPRTQPNQNLFPKGFVPESAPQNNRNLSGQDAARLLEDALRGIPQQPQRPAQPQQPNNGRRILPEGGMRPQTNNPPRYDYIPRQPDVVPQRIPVQPQPLQRGPTVVITPQPNVVPQNVPNVPPPIAAPLTDNTLEYDPADVAVLADEDYSAVQKALKDSIDADVKDLQTAADDLGVGDVPAVQEALDDIKDQVAAGEPVTDEMIEAYEKALETAVADKNDELTESDIKRIAKLTTDLQTRSEIAGMFDDEYPADPFDPVLPSDEIDLAVIPGLPPGQIFYLPGGGLITGIEPGEPIACLTTTTADLIGLPVGPSDAGFADVSDDKTGIRLYNDSETGGAVNFLLGGQSYSLEADRWEHVNPGSSREISFDPGNGGSPTRYSLTDGTYVFTLADGRWQLGSRKFKVTMESVGMDAPFHYQAGGESFELAPGATREHAGVYPIVIRFNRGKEGEDAERCFYDSAVRVSLAIDPADNLWEVFPTESVRVPQTKSEAKSVAKSGTKPASSVFDSSAFDSRTAKEKSGAGTSEKGGGASRPGKIAAAKKGAAFDLASFRKAMKAD
ncbi:hypothetical protein VT03_30920 [Planctomyces sp. SH-PL14]|nr:hypothetical protein VT03_30920 [Planctomyces sp. SH-PL14]